MNHCFLRRDEQDSVSVCAWVSGCIGRQPRLGWLSPGWSVALCWMDWLLPGCGGDPCGQRLLAKTIAAQKAQQYEVVLGGLIFGWLG